MKRLSMLLALTATAAAALACSSEDASNQFPSSTSEKAIASFIDSGSYKSWTHDSAIRSSEAGGLNPHGNQLRVYFNDAATTATEAPPNGAAVIKEIYDESGVLLGTAMSMKQDDSWTFYCNISSGSLCTGVANDLTVYEQDGLRCGGCHGDRFEAKLP